MPRAALLRKAVSVRAGSNKPSSQTSNKKQLSFRNSFSHVPKSLSTRAFFSRQNRQDTNDTSSQRDSESSSSDDGNSLDKKRSDSFGRNRTSFVLNNKYNDDDDDTGSVVSSLLTNLTQEAEPEDRRISLRRMASVSLKSIRSLKVSPDDWTTSRSDLKNFTVEENDEEEAGDEAYEKASMDDVSGRAAVNNNSNVESNNDKMGFQSDPYDYHGYAGDATWSAITSRTALRVYMLFVLISLMSWMLVFTITKAKQLRMDMDQIGSGNTGVNYIDITPAPSNLESFCAIKRIKMGRGAECERICSSANCCWDLSWDNCHEEKREVCRDYWPCQNLTPTGVDRDIFFINPQVVTNAILIVCDKNKFDTRENLENCRKLCAPRMCCFDEKQDCRRYKRDECDTFDACQILMTHQGI